MNFFQNPQINSLGLTFDDSYSNIATGTINCWVNKYYYPTFRSKSPREGFIFVCPTIDPSSIHVSINKSQKQLIIKGKQSQYNYLLMCNFPFIRLDHCIDADEDKRFDRDSISYKFVNGILTIEFYQVNDNQFELVRNQPIFNNKPDIKTFTSGERVFPSAYFPCFEFQKRDVLPPLNLVKNDIETQPPKSFSTPNLRNLNIDYQCNLPLPPIPPPAPEWLKKSIDNLGKNEIRYQRSDESSDNGLTVTPENESVIEILKKENFNGEWEYPNSELNNDKPTVEDE